MQVKCFACDALLEAHDADAIALAFAAHGREKHTWYPHTEPKASDAGHFNGPRSIYEARGFQPIETRGRYTVLRRRVG